MIFGPPGICHTQYESLAILILGLYRSISLILGTGKTKTIVEAVAQIVTKTNEKILLCSMSNTTCDVLATRLLAIDVIAEKQCVYRLYSRMTSPASIPPQLKPISNFYDVDDNENSFYPALKFLANFQVIVCTLTTAGRLAQAKMAEDYPGHFSYIIIDECACATESFCIIPIAGKNWIAICLSYPNCCVHIFLLCHYLGICTTRGAQPITAQIVLSGDPKQLGPVVKCSMANKLGYGTLFFIILVYTISFRLNKILSRF